MLKRERFEVNSTNAEAAARGDEFSINDRVVPHSAPGFGRRINLAGKSISQAADMVGMGMREHNGLWPEPFEFAQPIRATIDKNVIRHPQATMHTVKARPDINLAPRAREAQFHRAMLRWLAAPR